MTIQEEMVYYLENNPKFRERKYRGHLLCNLALRATGLGNKYSRGEKLTIQEMCDFAVKFDSYRHAWTDVMKDVIFLRGKDYEDKEVLEQNKLIEMGYTSGHYQDVNRLKKL